jgi:hypothetical protein
MATVPQSDLPSSMVPQSDLPSNLVPASDLPTASKGFSPVQMAINAPASLWRNTVGGLIEAVSNPAQTATTIMDVAAGGLRNVTPEKLRNFIDQFEGNPEARDRAVKMAKIVGGDYASVYGTSEGFKKALQDDPFRVLGDVSLMATGGAGLAGRAPAVASKMAKVAEVTNPMTAAGYVASKTLPTVGNVTANVLGLTTGVGPETVKTAYESGVRGAEAFKQNIRGQVEKTDVLDEARQALQTMRQSKSAAYQQGIGTTAADTTRLDFTPIDDAFNRIKGTLYEGSRAKVGETELNKIGEVESVLNEWRADPNAHTAIGLDALKQRLDAIYPDSPMQKQAQRVITETRKKVYDTIVQQSPEYAKTMSDYERAISLEKEIERALSLGKNASADTALRKLTSLARNNVNANYGYRLDLARALEQQGNADLLPAIAGQSMSATLPRGLAPQVAGAAAIPSAVQSFAAGVTPMSLMAAPFFSPRLVGEAAYGVGSAQRVLQQSALNRNVMAPTIANAQRLAAQIPMTPEQARLAALAAAKAGAIQGGLLYEPYRIELNNMAPNRP